VFRIVPNEVPILFALFWISKPASLRPLARGATRTAEIVVQDIESSRCATHLAPAGGDIFLLRIPALD
jgi:hypothetical protein